MARWFFVLVLLMVVGGCSSVPRAAAPAGAGSAIVWRSYGPAAFEEARRDGKLVLVDVGIEGCTACRWMYEETYRHPAVVARVAKSFVAVAVDADVQPDLGARFEEWGWPATIAMTPAGEQVLALRGNRAPDDFVRILDDLLRRQKDGKLQGAAAPAPKRAT